MSDFKKDDEIKEVYVIESDESSSEAPNYVRKTPTVIKEVGKASSSKQYEDECWNTPEMPQAKGIRQEDLARSLMHHESVQAPTDELPRKRNNVRNEDIGAASSQPSRRRFRRSTRATSNAAAAEERVPRRSVRIRDQNEVSPGHEGLWATNDLSGKHLLCMEKKRGAYEWSFPDSDDED